MSWEKLFWDTKRRTAYDETRGGRAYNKYEVEISGLGFTVLLIAGFGAFASLVVAARVIFVLWGPVPLILAGIALAWAALTTVFIAHRRSTKLAAVNTEIERASQ
jgi:hypothetical protein